MTWAKLLNRQFVISGVVILICSFFVSVGFAQEDCGEGCDELDSALYTLPDAFYSMSIDSSLLSDRAYRRLIGTVNIYDAPNGTLLRTIDTGFNFVTILEQQGDWVRINGDEWALASHIQPVEPISTFTGFFFTDDVAEGSVVSWALVNMYPSREPGGTPDETQDIIYRYTPLTITEYIEVDTERWYKVGDYQWVHQYRVAKVIPLTEKPEGVDTDIWVGIDLYEQVLIAYQGITPVFTTLISTGLPRWPTYEGVFNIYYRTPRKNMSWGTVGDDFYFLEEVPWTMFFDEGRALHGAYWHDGFGYRRSHGCVNISINDAKWLYDWVSAHMGSIASADIEVGPNVYVYTTGQYE